MAKKKGDNIPIAKNWNRVKTLFHVSNSLQFIFGILLDLTVWVNGISSSIRKDIDLLVRTGYIVCGTAAVSMAITGSGSEIKQNHFGLVLNFTITFCIALLTLFSFVLACVQFDDISMVIDSEFETKFKKMLNSSKMSQTTIAFMSKLECCGWFSSTELFQNGTLPGFCCPKQNLRLNQSLEECTFDKSYQGCYFKSLSIFKSDMKVINKLAFGLILTSLFSSYTSYIISVNIRELFFFK